MNYKYTNEALKKKFKNQFELVSYAILLAENMILTGRESRVKTDYQNKAMQVLAEIAAGKDLFEPIIPVEQKKEESSTGFSSSAAQNAPFKGSEKKKNRKILVE